MSDLVWWELLLLSGVGCIAGFLNVMAGGGSLLSMSVMQSMGMVGSLANGTNRLAILCQNISGAISFYRQGLRNVRESFWLAACALPGCIFGARIGTEFDGIWFRRLLALIMVTLLVLMVVKKRNADPAISSAETVVISIWRRVCGYLLLVLVGFYGGIIQAGVGYVLILVLHRVLGYSLVRTNAHKVVIIGSYTVLALVVFARQNDILWIPAMALAVGNAVGAWFGAAFAVKKGDRVIRSILLSMMTLIAVYLVVRSF